MNSLAEKMGEMFGGTQQLRFQVLEMLTDQDLQFAVTGNPTLGALFRQEGEFEHAYAESFKTLRMDFSYRHADAAVETSVEALKSWFRSIDAALMAAINAFSEADLQARQIDRGGWMAPLALQADVYIQALLICFGKVSVYLRAMGKPLPQQWNEWIG
ncbi:MAG: hypothetical protein SF162_14725 [bacterium]|nr:hypothetical protein [bacterium]